MSRPVLKCDDLQGNIDSECYDFFDFSNEYGASTAFCIGKPSDGNNYNHNQPQDSDYYLIKESDSDLVI